MKQREWSYLDESLAWLIREAPGLLGERSNLGATVLTLECGGARSCTNDFEPSDLVLMHVERARTLGRVWATLFRDTQKVLLAYYTPREKWPAGFDSHIGRDLASVTLAFPPDGDRKALVEACSGYSVTRNRDLVERAKTEALDLVREAHASWRDAKASLLRPTRGRWSAETRERLSEFSEGFR